MRTFCIQTLGCRVNQYESEQIAALLRTRGMVQTEPADADLRVINTCSVTVQAAGKSRQSTRRATRLPVLQPTHGDIPASQGVWPTGQHAGLDARPRPRVVVTGCWATSNAADARRIPGVDAVLGHGDQVADELRRLLDTWLADPDNGAAATSTQQGADSCDADARGAVPKAFGGDGWMIPGERLRYRASNTNKPRATRPVKENPSRLPPDAIETDHRPAAALRGTTTLPILDARQSAHQRAYLKIQDGCDAHCTYCIIPKLRPVLWSKPPELVIEEARRLVAAGHRELVLTGIFLGAYAQPSALRRRQGHSTSRPLARLARLLCQQVPGLHRLRFSSLEPGDLDPHLIDAFRHIPQLVPHFHLPLQSGSDDILRRMNRQYTRDDFLRMLEQVHAAFDRPAITTDIIVGFPGETDEHFARTLDLVDRARFIHIHAFHFSPRPGTAAARWTRDFVRGPQVNQRIAQLQGRAVAHDLAFRRQFIGQVVELLVERPSSAPSDASIGATPLRHGRCERYFTVHFESATARTGDLVRVRIDTVTPHMTRGTFLP